MQHQLSAMIESFLFIAGDEGLTLKQLVNLTGAVEKDVEIAIREMTSRYDDLKYHGLTIKQYGGAYRLVTKSALADDVKRMLENPAPQTITKASLEVLAIIAYQQPVTRIEIDDLRGVKSEGPIQTLISRGLIMEKGRSDGPGRAILYGTTDLFLNKFGLVSLDHLPPLSQENFVEGDQDTDLFMTQFQEAFTLDDEGAIE